MRTLLEQLHDQPAATVVDSQIQKQRNPISVVYQTKYLPLIHWCPSPNKPASTIIPCIQKPRLYLRWPWFTSARSIIRLRLALAGPSLRVPAPRGLTDRGSLAQLAVARPQKGSVAR